MSGQYPFNHPYGHHAHQAEAVGTTGGAAASNTVCIVVVILVGVCVVGIALGVGLGVGLTRKTTNKSPTTTAATTVEEKLYANEVLEFSSQVNATAWYANGLLYKEDIYPQYSDDPNSWSPEHANSSSDYVTVKFNKSICISAVDIYETHSGGGVTKIWAHRPSGVPFEDEEEHSWDVLYSRNGLPTAADVIKVARIFSPPFDRLQYKTDVIRFYVHEQPDWNDTQYVNWVEIDAIAIRGNTDCPDSPMTTLDINQIIDKNAQNFMTYWNNNDMASVSTLYAADCRYMSQGSDVQIGRDAVIASFDAAYASGATLLKLQTDEIVPQAKADFIIERGHYWMTNSTGGVVEVGKYAEIWKNIGGWYYLYMDVFNTN